MKPSLKLFDFNEKSDYFKNLEKRKIENVDKVRNIKIDVMNEYFENKEDYSYLYNRNSNKFVLPQIIRNSKKQIYVDEYEIIKQSDNNKKLNKDLDKNYVNITSNKKNNQKHGNKKSETINYEIIKMMKKIKEDRINNFNKSKINTLSQNTDILTSRTGFFTSFTKTDALN